MPKSKVEILIETANFYTTENRAEERTSMFSKCYFLTEDGRRCGFGRCMREDLPPEIYNFKAGVKGLSDVIKWFKFSSLDDILKPEYRGHSLDFWRNIQVFHDTSSHWTATGLSKEGKKFYERSIQIWGEA